MFDMLLMILYIIFICIIILYIIYIIIILYYYISIHNIENNIIFNTKYKTCNKKQSNINKKNENDILTNELLMNKHYIIEEFDNNFKYEQKSLSNNDNHDKNIFAEAFKKYQLNIDTSQDYINYISDDKILANINTNIHNSIVKSSIADKAKTEAEMSFDVEYYLEYIMESYYKSLKNIFKHFDSINQIFNTIEQLFNLIDKFYALERIAVTNNTKKNFYNTQDIFFKKYQDIFDNSFLAMDNGINIIFKFFNIACEESKIFIDESLYHLTNLDLNNNRYDRHVTAIVNYLEKFEYIIKEFKIINIKYNQFLDIFQKKWYQLMFYLINNNNITNLSILFKIDNNILKYNKDYFDYCLIFNYYKNMLLHFELYLDNNLNIINKHISDIYIN